LNYNSTQGGASPSPLVPGNTYTAGAAVQLYASASSGYHFTGWSGDASGTANPTPITMNGNKSVTANFAIGDPNMGTVVVTIQPPAAAAAGVKWGTYYDNYRDSGTSYTTFAGGYFLVLHPVDGWITPIPNNLLHVTVTGGQTTNITVIFTQDTTPGLLTVTVTPPNAVAAGAAWHVNGGAAQGNGTTASLPPGSYTVTFDSIPGWTTPHAQTMQVVRAQTAVVTGNYTPPVGQPLITAIHPGFGSLAGGTPLTIEGVNFTAPVTVWIGGKSATNVNVLSSSQITCLIPSNSVYGTQPVVVQTSGGNATNLNGFAYGTPRGSGIELVASLGGRESGVAVQGNYAYVGEGSSLLLVNVSSPSSPSLVSRLAMPANVLDIALNGQYAYVADGDAGLQVVDISNPATPLLKGFYQTPGWASGIAIQGGKAYVADGAGLEVIDLREPKYPSLLASTNYNGGADDVVIQTNGSGVFAYLSSGEYISVIDVSQASAPVLRGHVHIGGTASYSIAVSGKYVFAASAGDGLHMVDVSNADAPLDLGSVPAAELPDAVATVNGLLHAVNYSGYYVFSVSGSTLSQVGHTTGITSGGGVRMAVSGNRAYIAGSSSGLTIVDVSNSANPSQLATFTDFGACGDYFSAAASGNTLCASVASDLKVFDISQRGQPNLVGQLSGIGFGGQVLARDGIAYLRGSGVDAGGCTRIISIATPSSPQLLTTIPNTSVWNRRMALAGNRLYVVGHNETQQARFSAFDVSTPSSPPLLGVQDYPTLGAGSAAISVAVNGSKALVGIQGNSVPMK
ncbi:MAG: IPT/TIG domain-containing protein, partial [Verrucomicrobia bacterium]|nr:IPT/TIG domain-containing protein [Verrucomicrobiota bacterium]